MPVNFLKAGEVCEPARWLLEAAAADTFPVSHGELRPLKGRKTASVLILRRLSVARDGQGRAAAGTQVEHGRKRLPRQGVCRVAAVPDPHREVVEGGGRTGGHC